MSEMMAQLLAKQGEVTDHSGEEPADVPPSDHYQPPPQITAESAAELEAGAPPSA
jgi:hypothetical protein